MDWNSHPFRGFQLNQRIEVLGLAEEGFPSSFYSGVIISLQPPAEQDPVALIEYDDVRILCMLIKDFSFEKLLEG